MPPRRTPTLRLRARGPWACFTRPELKVERVSYPVMPPSAARGLLEAVLWKPAIRWRIERIRVHRSIRCTPAMVAGITASIWKMGDLLEA